MAVVKTIDVALRANVEKFEQGMKKGGDALQGFLGHIPGFDALTSRLSTTAGIVGTVTAAFVGLAAAAKNAINETSRVGDLSFEFGIDPNKLLGLEHAFATVGVSTEELQRGLRELTLRAGEAADGSKELQRTFNQLGINVERFTSLPADQKLRVVADALNAVENATQRSFLASELFGKGGLAPMLEVLGLGSKGLDEAADKALRLGNVLSNEGVRATQEWEKSVAELKLAWDGFSQLTLKLAAPAITGIARAVEFATNAYAKLRSIVLAGSDSFERWRIEADAAAEATRQASQFQPRPMTDMEKDAFRRAQMEREVQRGIQLSMERTAAAQKQFTANLIESMNQARADAKAMIESLNVTTPLDEHLAKLKKIHELYGMNLLTIDQRNKLLEKAARDFRAPEAEKALELRKQLMAEADEIRERLQTPLERFQKSTAHLARLRDIGAIDQRTFARGFQEAAQLFRDEATRFVEQRTQGPAAVSGGTQEAFRAFQENRSSQQVSKEQLTIQRKIEEHLRKLSRSPIVLAAADLGGR